MGSTQQIESAPSEVSVILRPSTAETVVAVYRLAVRPEQERFVAPNAVSPAQALFEDLA